MLFIGLVFGVGFRWLWMPEKWSTLAATIVGQYLFKLLLAALDTPFFYLMTRGNGTPSDNASNTNFNGL